MRISVRVKPSHPSGSYGRAGLRFSTEATVVDTATLDQDQVEALRKDPWLVIEPAKREAIDPEKDKK